MGNIPQDKIKTTDANDSSAGASPATLYQTSSTSEGQKSWGDKYKHGTLHFIRNILVNYVINFGISAAGTYAVLNSPINKHFDSFIAKSVEQGNKINMPEGLSSGIAKFFSRTQLLLCGGHVLLPFMKYTHDNRNKLEFSIGHKLDSLQESLGKGNEATRRNLTEYKYINDLMKAKTNPAELTDDDKALLAKNHIDNNLQFNEHRQTWAHVIKARATGVSLTTTMGILFGVSGKFPEKYRMDTITRKAGGILSENAGFKKIPKALIKHPEQLGEFAFLELLYTAGSKLGFDHMEKRQIRKQEEAEAAAARAHLPDDRSALPTEDMQGSRNFAARTASVLETRKKLSQGGEQDFRTRESLKPVDSSLAVS